MNRQAALRVLIFIVVLCLALKFFGVLRYLVSAAITLGVIALVIHLLWREFRPTRER